MNNKLSKKVILLASASALLFANFAFAQNRQGERPMMGRGNPAIFGTVTSISGNTIIISSNIGPKSTTTKSYTIDATNAIVYKNNATSSISSIISGDKIVAQGTMSGATVTAKVIRDDVMAKNFKLGEGEKREFSSSTKEMDRVDLRNGNVSSTHENRNEWKNRQVGSASGTPQVSDDNNGQNRGVVNRVKSFFGRIFGF